MQIRLWLFHRRLCTIGNPPYFDFTGKSCWQVDTENAKDKIHGTRISIRLTWSVNKLKDFYLIITSAADFKCDYLYLRPDIDKINNQMVGFDGLTVPTVL